MSKITIVPDILRVLYYASEEMTMTVSKAQQQAVSKYMKANYDELKIRIPKGNKARIQEHAKAQGESTNAFIYRAVKETIARDEQK